MRATFGGSYVVAHNAGWRFAATVWLLVSIGWAADFATVEGSLRNPVTGMGVNHAAVRLIPMHRPAFGYTGMTGVDGAFHFENVEPGDYEIWAERAGFAAIQPEKLHLDSGQKARDLTIQAIPLATVMGKVLDSDGDPVPGAQVQAVRAGWLRGKRSYEAERSAQIDERGEFRLEDLDPGRYKLFASAPGNGPLSFEISEGPGKPEFHLAPAYYSSGQDVDAAASVDLAPGQELGGIEIKLPMLPAFHLRGSAETPPRTERGLPVVIEAVKMDKGRRAEWFEFVSQLKPDGTFDIAGVPPGQYMLSDAGFSEPMMMEFVPATVASHDINGIMMPKAAPARVTVLVKYSGNAASQRGNLEFLLQRMEETPAWARWARPAMTRREDGSPVFDWVTPGKYAPLLGNEDWHVESMAYNGQPVTHDGISIERGSEGRLEVILGRGSASISGKIEANGKRQVVLVAEDTSPGNATVRQKAAAEDGEFSFQNLAPGQYLVFAVPQNGTWPWDNPDFVSRLRDQAAAVELIENAGVQVIVATVPEEVLRQAEEATP